MPKKLRPKRKSTVISIHLSLQVFLSLSIQYFLRGRLNFASQPRSKTINTTPPIYQDLPCSPVPSKTRCCKRFWWKFRAQDIKVCRPSPSCHWIFYSICFNTSGRCYSLIMIFAGRFLNYLRDVLIFDDMRVFVVFPIWWIGAKLCVALKCWRCKGLTIFLLFSERVMFLEILIISIIIGDFSWCRCNSVRVAMCHTYMPFK